MIGDGVRDRIDTEALGLLVLESVLAMGPHLDGDVREYNMF